MQLPVVLNVAVCIPARNEVANLGELLLELDDALDHPLIGDSWVVVFDDGSEDGTFDRLKDQKFRQFELQVLRSITPQGKSLALQNAIDEALSLDSDVIVLMDADCQDDPAHIPSLVEELTLGHDVVNGRRMNREHSVPRNLSSQAFSVAVRTLTNVKIRDTNSGYRAFSRSAAQALRPYLYGELHRVILVIAVWVGLQVSEVSVVSRPRRSGRSKDGVLRGWRGIFDLMVLRFVRRHHHRPGRFFWGLGSFTLGLGFVAPLAFFAGGLGVEEFVAHTAVLAVTVAAISLAMVLFSLGLVADLLVFILRSPSTAVLQTRDSYHGSDGGPLAPKEGSSAGSRA